MTLAAGSRLGPYEILAPLGAGGMGEVYKARDTRLDRTVAVKVLPEHLSSSEESRQRFEREAKTISQLSHPHICALYDVGREGQTEYLVMELLEGETLSDRLGKGPLSLEQTLRYGVEMAGALDRAHRSGIVHRDLKPGNVMLTKSGVKLLDFGLAKAMSPGGTAGSLTAFPTQANLTQEGTILGTFQYMAPEQLEGREADARTDIFALGAVLYEMATGRKAFSGTSQASLISSIMSSDPQPISSLQPMSPPALDRVVKTCLAKDPERRWQSARDVALELEDAGGPTSLRAAVGSARSGRREAVAWLVAAGLLLLLGMLGPWRRPRPGGAPALRFTVPPPAGAAFQGMLALSPDGRRLAFVATTPAGRDALFVRPLDALDARLLEGTDGAAFPFWSPDGRFLAFFAGGKLKRVDSSGGPPQTLCDAPGPRGGSWGGGGTIVFSSNVGGQMRIVREAGGEARPLERLTSQHGEVYRWPRFLPDGRHFLYSAILGEANKTGVFVGSTESQERKRLVAGDSGAAYTPPGHLIYRRGDQLFAQPFDLAGLRVTGEAFPVVEDVSWNGISTLATAFSVSESGVLAYQTGGVAVSRLLVYDRTGREVGAVGAPGAYLEPALSPDGRWLAVTRAEPNGSVSIWTTELDRGSFTRLSPDGTATPVWSPDGRRIAYSAFPSGAVSARDVRGVEKATLLYTAPNFSPLDDWSRDGRFLFREVIDWRTFHFDVAVRDLVNATERPLLTEPFDEMGARLSPDGRSLAYESDESGAHEVFVRSFPELGQRRQISPAGGSQPRWRGDGRELFYVSPDRRLMSVEVGAGADLQLGAPRALFSTRILPAIEARNQYDVSGDGQRFIVNSRRPEDDSLPITVVVGWAPRSVK